MTISTSIDGSTQYGRFRQYLWMLTTKDTLTILMHRRKSFGLYNLQRNSRILQLEVKRELEKARQVLLKLIKEERLSTVQNLLHYQILAEAAVAAVAAVAATSAAAAAAAAAAAVIC